MGIFDRLFRRKKEKAVVDLTHLSNLCRQMGDAIAEKIPPEQDALIWAHSTLASGSKSLAEAMELKQKYLARVEQTGARFLGRSVRIMSSPANNFWKGGRPPQHIGQDGRVTEFQFNSVAHRRGFSGASFAIELANGDAIRALVEEIEVIGGTHEKKETTYRISQPDLYLLRVKTCVFG